MMQKKMVEWEEEVIIIVDVEVGAGNPTAITGSYTSFGDGTGGLIILIVHGQLLIGDNGKIESKGVKGQNGSTSWISGSNQVAGGGGRKWWWFY